MGSAQNNRLLPVHNSDLFLKLPVFQAAACVRFAADSRTLMGMGGAVAKVSSVQCECIDDIQPGQTVFKGEGFCTTSSRLSTKLNYFYFRVFFGSC